RNQAIASVSVRSNGLSADDPRFFQNRFEGNGSGIGIEALAAVAGSYVAPDVEECTFRNLATAVRIRASHFPGACTAAGQVRSCNLTDCDTGVHVSSAGSVQTTLSVAVDHCRFADCDTGVYAETLSGGLATTSQDDVTVANSVFIRCAAGVAARVQLPSSGGQDLSVSNSTFNECGFGIDCWALGVFFNQRTFTGLTMHDCA